MFSFFTSNNEEEEKKPNSMIEVNRLSAQSANPSFVDSEYASTAVVTAPGGGS